MPSCARTVRAAVFIPVAATVVATSASATPSASPARTQSAGTTSAARQTVGTASTTNWAGYQMRLPDPREAHASWRMPTVAWQGRDGYSNQWVGLGGGTAAQGQLLQAGTEHDTVCTALRRGRCSASRSTYFLWLETYPQRTLERITNLTVRPGDTVDVTADYSPGTRSAAFTLCNLTRKACVQASRPSPPPRGVLEYIVERPTNATGRQLPLANFRSASFAGMSAKNSLRALRPGGLPLTRLTMGTGRALASSGPLNADGSGFSTWYHRPV